MTREAAAYLRWKRYQAEKKPRGGDRTGEGADGQNDQFTTAERLAREYKVSEATIRRGERFARAVDGIAANCGAEARNLILSRNTGLTRGRVMKLAKMTPAEQRKFLQTLKEQGKVPRRKAGQRLTITLPAEPKSMVERLVKRLGRETAAEVSRMLAQLLKEEMSEEEK